MTSSRTYPAPRFARHHIVALESRRRSLPRPRPQKNRARPRRAFRVPLPTLLPTRNLGPSRIRVGASLEALLPAVPTTRQPARGTAPLLRRALGAAAAGGEPARKPEVPGGQAGACGRGTRWSAPPPPPPARRGPRAPPCGRRTRGAPRHLRDGGREGGRRGQGTRGDGGECGGGRRVRAGAG